MHGVPAGQNVAEAVSVQAAPLMGGIEKTGSMNPAS